MALVRGVGVRGCALLLAAHVFACSDDGVPAATDDASDGGTAGATISGSDATMTGTTAESSITDAGPTTGSGTTTTTADDTTGTATSPSDTSSAETGTGTDTGATTGDPSEPCAASSQCQVVDNCCECTAIPADAEPAACEKQCDQSMCAAIGIDPIAQCELGSCELAPVPCNALEVSCDSKPPNCPEGALPSVDPSTMCWTNECVPAQYCDVVSSCADCAQDEVCVQNIAQLPTVYCSPIPAQCEGVPSCECMGDVCQEPFGTCNDDGDGIDCICIAC